MGNDQSNIPDIDLVEKAIEVCDFWTQHSAAIYDGEHASYLTVFIGDLFVNGTLWTSQTPLEKNAKHMMIYRHPCIIKYISSWQRNSKFHLAVEEISPLSQELSKLNFLQISIGLHSILKALDFLHTNAGVSHNNVCASSIYLSKEGNWKLGGMEYLCKYKDLTCDYLNKTRSIRYSKSLDPNEDKLFQSNLSRKYCIDVYAFGIFATDVLKSVKCEGDSYTAFLDFCKNDMLNPDVSKRPTFKSILEHDFFNHQFIAIHSFLLELPLKSDNEKSQFFQELVSQLFQFDEEIVASQLSGLLLSRMVFLNKTAQASLLPFLLTPQTEVLDKTTHLFSMEMFKKYLSPKLIEIFKVRDREIRWFLLSFFPKYMDTFSKEELQNKILPELLVGIKDTDDHLVSLTLQTLAILVPILGSATVIGGKRAKLFTDGRPTISIRRISSKNIKPSVIEETDQTSISSLNNSELPERPRPDGEEGETSTEELEPSVNEDLDNWEDWDVNEAHQSVNNEVEIPDLEINQIELVDHKTKPNIIPDILQLDIKNQAFSDDNDFNFFQDMEPVINNTNAFLVEKNEHLKSDKLSLNVIDTETNADWDEEEWD